MKHLQTKQKAKQSKARRLRQFLNRDVNMGVSALQSAAL
jgi:hypothetical protein